MLLRFVPVDPVLTRYDPRPAALLALTLAACGGGGGGGASTSVPFIPVTVAGISVAADSPLVISGPSLAFLSSEGTTGSGTGTDLNDDSDRMDHIATVVDLVTGDQDVLDDAAAEMTVAPSQRLAWVGQNLYMVVDEAAAGRDWNGVGGPVDCVLLHWSDSFGGPTLVDTLPSSGATKMFAVGNRLVYEAADGPAGDFETNLRYVVDGPAPTGVRAISTTDPLPGGLDLHLFEADEGIVFLYADEAENGFVDLNGNGEMDEGVVLFLLNGGEVGGEALNTGIALRGTTTPVRALAEGGSWTVAFLAFEADNNENYNDPLHPDLGANWRPPQCAGPADTDLNDEVLHWLDFAAFESDPGANPPRNTGLVGTDRVLAVPGFVATATLEADEGDSLAVFPGCDLNGDGDRLDLIFRWVRATTPALPPNNAGRLHALALVAGTARGAAELAGRWVIQVDEAADGRNLGGAPGMGDQLLAVHDPNHPAQFFGFDHGPLPGTYGSGTWIEEVPGRSRVLTAFRELTFDQDLNGDGDRDDSVPVFLTNGAGNDLDLPGVAVAVDPINPGMVLAQDIGFYRLSEAGEGLDVNFDGDLGDFILQRISLSSGAQSVSMATLNSLAGPAITSGPEADPVGAAFLVEEALVGPGGGDLNGDGDTGDVVVRYFRM